MTRIRQVTWEAFLARPCEKTFRPLYEESKALVYTICLRILRNEADAADAFQTTYCRVLSLARDTGAPERSGEPVPLVSRLAAREADALGKRQARRGKREVSMAEVPLDRGRGESVESSLERELEREHVERMVNTLPDKLRVPVLLHYFHGLTHEEIAAALGLTRPTVSNRIYRAIRKLEPVFRRARLGETAAALGLVLTSAELQQVPAAFTAESVFSSASALLAAGQGAGLAGTASVGGTAVGASVAAAVALLKTQAALFVGCAVLCAAAAVGVATGWIGGRGGDPDDAGPVAGAGRLTDGPGTGSESRRLRGGPQGTRPRPAEGAPGVSGAPEKAVGTGPGQTTLYGRVTLRETGEPMAGATVILIPCNRTTMTRDDGTYEIAGACEPSTHVAAFKGPHVSHLRQSDVVPTPLEPGQRNGPVDLALLEGLRLSGRITDRETGEPLAGARLSVHLFQERAAVTDAEGRYVFEGLPAMRLSLEISAEGHAFHRTFIQPREDASNVYDFSLDPEASVIVTVTDEAGEPVAGVRVAYHLEDSFVGWDRGGSTDADGRVCIDGISAREPPRLEVSKKGYRIEGDLVPRFDEGIRSTEAYLVLRRLEDEAPPGVFTGKVTSSSGEPIQGARLRWAPAERPESGSESCETDIRGRYRLEVQSTQRGEQLSVSAPGYAPAWEPGLEPGTTSSPAVADFVLEKGHSIEGVVTDSDDQPIAGVMLYPFYNGGDHPYDDHQIPGQPTPMEPCRTDGQGRFLLKDLPEGELFLSLWRHGFSDLRRFPCGSGQEVTIRLQEAGVIRGRVLDEQTGEPVPRFVVKIHGGGVSVSRGGPGQAFHGGDGRFVLHDLNQDRPYRLRIEADGYAALDEEGVPAVSPDSETEVPFRLRPPRSAAGRVVRADTGVGVAGATVVSAVVPQGRMLGWDYLDGRLGDYYRDVRALPTGADGSFALVEGTDSATLFITAPGYARRVICPADRSPSTPEGADELRIALAPEARLTVTVDVPGLVEGSARVLLSHTGSPRYTLEARSEGRDRFGAENLAAGPYRISVRKREGNTEYSCLSRGVALREGESKELQLGHDLGPYVLSGKVLDADGLPVPDVRVVLTGRSIAGYEQAVDHTDAGGAYVIEGLHPGRCRVTASKHLHSTTGFRELKTAVDLEIAGDTVQDLAFRRQRHVTMHLEAGASSLQRVQLSRLALPLLGSWNDASRPVASTSAVIEDGVATLEGWFRGRYRLTVICALGSGQTTQVVVRDALLIDTSEKDIDLGTLVVPSPGPATLTGSVLDADGDPVPGARVRLEPGYPTAQLWHVTRSNEAGAFQLDGLENGTHVATVTASRSDGGPGPELRREIEIRGSGSEIFHFREEHEVLLQLECDSGAAEATRPLFTGARLERVDWDGGSPFAEDGTLAYASTSIEEGVARFRGRLKGSYILTLAAKTEQCSLWGMLPREVRLDNLDGDQDLGAVSIPVDPGRLRIRLDADDSFGLPRHVTVSLFPQEGPDRPLQTTLPRREGPLEVDLVPPGRYEVWLEVPGFRTEPALVPVSIPGGSSTPEVGFHLRACGTVSGTVRTGLTSRDGKSRMWVRLQGAAVDRMLDAGPEGSRSPLYWEAVRLRGDWLRGSRFRFVDVPQGTYTLTVGMEGRPEHAETVEVVPGTETALLFVLPAPRGIR